MFDLEGELDYHYHKGIGGGIGSTKGKSHLPIISLIFGQTIFKIMIISSILENSSDAIFPYN